MNNIKIIPLGGVREGGKNLFVVEVNDSIFVLDCGSLYPEDELLGIDAVIPDFSYLEDNAERVVGIFLTHGHADAVGALPYLLEVIDAPVFGTELTIELASILAKERGLEDRLESFFKIDEETEIEFEDASVSFFRTTHSIPDSVGIVVETKEGAIVYTGDFKFEPSAKPLYRTNFGRLTDIGEAGVLALLSDSAEAESQVENVSDMKIQEDIVETFRNAEGRVIVATVGSNILRIQQVLEAAYQSQRTVFIPGENLAEIVDVAIKLDKIIIPSKRVIGQMSQLNNTPDEKVLILETGTAGEPIKSLQLMAQQRHRQVKIKEGDLVFLASTPSIAYETALARTKNMIYRAGATVKEITDNFKTSGHATPNDLKMMMNFLKPKYIIPVNGEYRMLAAHAELAIQVGYKEEQIFLPELGDVIEYSRGKMTMTRKVEAGNVLVDGTGVGDIGSVVLRDRRILSEDGIFIVVATISRRLGRVLVGPQITSRGFMFMKTNIDLIEACSNMTLDVLEEHLASENFDWVELKSDLRDRIAKYLYKETKRKPVVLPIIMEASGYQMADETKMK
ncbi:ribonuclease J [Aerococcaceae bacterium NML210727]|nr:ribonuclease J [Aerococcaceae bacterium NML210727]MCW6654114.1 ribonuclease J [Aerococcaceae bacterium NML201296]MCW6661813.1 ribonuclease J [Aerococcaceae bacterium NML201209]MCW6680745.1 ribonuclease J [Aerococcaceae bacterium NML130460]